MESDVPIVAATYRDRHEAELARTTLEAAGIQAALQTDDAGGFHPELSLTRGVKVVVRTRDLASAREILAPSGFSEESP